MSYRHIAQTDAEFREYRKQVIVEAMKRFDMKAFQALLKKAKKPEQVQRIYELTLMGLYSEEIALNLEITPKAVQKSWRRYGFPHFQNIAPPTREIRPGWKGGVKVVRNYEYARTPGHPRASKHGEYVAVHRLVVEQHLGRYLEPGEVVDHIDGNPRNNSIENLRVFASNGEHLRVTLTGKPKNMTPEGRQRIRETRQRQASTPEGREALRAIGKRNAHYLRAGFEKWKNTPEGRQHFSKMGKKNHYRRIEGLKHWRETPEGKEAMKAWGRQNLRFLHPDLYPEGLPRESTHDLTKTDV